jgi:hypothetical protein
MTLSPVARMWFYIGMAVTPIWGDFFKNSTDYSLRGLMIPFFVSLNAAFVVVLAKSSPVQKQDSTDTTTVSVEPSKPAEPQPVPGMFTVTKTVTKRAPKKGKK